MIIITTADLIGDRDEGISLEHLLIEGGLILVGLIGLGLMLRVIANTRREAQLARDVAQGAQATADAERHRADDAIAEAHELETALAQSRAEAARWRGEAQELLNGLAEAIDKQFDRWELSQSEREVALLMLKGLSHQEIADLRQVKAATTRQQARAVYKKAGLEGRHDLAAFFLEDLLMPLSARE